VTDSSLHVVQHPVRPKAAAKFIAIAALVSIVAWLAASKAVSTGDHAAEGVAAIVTAAVVLLASVSFMLLPYWWTNFVTRRPGPATRTGATGMVLVLAWLGLLTVALVNAWLVDIGAAKLDLDPGQSAPEGATLWGQAFHTEWVVFLGGVPVLEIPDTLRLKAPLEYTDSLTGIAEFVFKVVLVGQLVAAVRSIWGRPDPKSLEEAKAAIAAEEKLEQMDAKDREASAQRPIQG
jgi:hypothetical protein